MKAKQLALGIAALLVAASLWLARTNSSTDASQNSPANGNLETQRARGQSKPGETFNSPPRLAPPNPIRKFQEFTPEQRVEFARKGHGPGG